MGIFVRKASTASDIYGSIVHYVDENGFIRKSSGPSDKNGAIVYYVGTDGFVRKPSVPSDKNGAIVYYVDDDGFIRKSSGPSDKNGATVYYVGDDGFIRKSNGTGHKYGAILYYIDDEFEEDAESASKEELSDASMPEGETLSGGASAPTDVMTRELTAYKQLFDNGLISEDEYKALKDNLFRELGITRRGNSMAAVISLWVCNILNFLGIFINIMIAIGVNGYLRSMYKYILDGYIAGFSVVAICTIAIMAISIAIRKRAETNVMVKNAITGGITSMALTAFLMLISAFL